MKTKFILINKETNENEIFYLSKKGKEICALYKDRIIPQLPNGSSTIWNGQSKIVNDSVNIIDLGNKRIMVISSNQFAAPEVRVEDGYRVKSNRVLNNLKASLPLLIGFIFVIVFFAVVSIIM